MQTDIPTTAGKKLRSFYIDRDVDEALRRAASSIGISDGAFVRAALADSPLIRAQLKELRAEGWAPKKPGKWVKRWVAAAPDGAL